jgi:DNA-directed RNA polymerase specialized sigma24 family protein
MSHANARLTPKGRSILVDRIGSGWTITEAARAVGISRQTGSISVHRRSDARYRQENRCSTQFGDGYGDRLQDGD